MTNLLERAATKLILFNFALSLAMVFVSATGIYQFQVLAPAMGGGPLGFVKTGWHMLVDSSAILMMQLGILPSVAHFIQFAETFIIGLYLAMKFTQILGKAGFLSMLFQ